MKRLILPVLLLLSPLAHAEELTADNLISLMEPHGSFRVPMTIKTFESIRSLSEQDAERVRSHFKQSKLSALNAKKSQLESALSDVNASILTAEASVEEEVIPQ